MNLPRIVGVGSAVPPNIIDQATACRDVIAYFSRHWAHAERLGAVFTHAAIDKRHFVVPRAWFDSEHSLAERNTVYLREATAIGQQAIERALAQAGLVPNDVDNLLTVSSTGIATPSLDALLINRLGMRSDVRRTPIWGLGCAGGVAGLARAGELARALPDSITVLMCVETCGLTFQAEDISKKGFIATALFADGAAAVVVAGANRAASGPQIVDAQSTLWPDSLRVMGWDVVDNGLEVVFGVEIPRYVADLFPPEVCRLLNRHGMRIDQIAHLVLHPGGAKVLQAYSESLGIGWDRLLASREVLRQYGNMSSPTVLFVLEQVLQHDAPQPGEYGLAAALGPGFSAEQVLLRF